MRGLTSFLNVNQRADLSCCAKRLCEVFTPLACPCPPVTAVVYAQCSSIEFVALTKRAQADHQRAPKPRGERTFHEGMDESSHDQAHDDSRGHGAVLAEHLVSAVDDVETPVLVDEVQRVSERASKRQPGPLNSLWTTVSRTQPRQGTSRPAAPKSPGPTRPVGDVVPGCDVCHRQRHRQAPVPRQRGPTRASCARRGRSGTASFRPRSRARSRAPGAWRPDPGSVWEATSPRTGHRAQTATTRRRLMPMSMKTPISR